MLNYQRVNHGINHLSTGAGICHHPQYDLYDDIAIVGGINMNKHHRKAALTERYFIKTSYRRERTKPGIAGF